MGGVTMRPYRLMADFGSVGLWRCVVRAASAGTRGAVVVRKPVPVVVCKTVWVNGVRVKKCS